MGDGCTAAAEWADCAELDGSATMRACPGRIPLLDCLTMDRRAFLMTCSTATVAAAVGHRALFHVDPAWTVAGEALFPGAPLRVDLSDAVPPGASVRVAISCEHGRFQHGVYTAQPNRRLEFETPDPFDDLVPGAYAVELELVSRNGAVLERRVVGGYRLLPHRFSA